MQGPQGAANPQCHQPQPSEPAVRAGSANQDPPSLRNRIGAAVSASTAGTRVLSPQRCLEMPTDGQFWRGEGRRVSPPHTSCNAALGTQILKTTLVPSAFGDTYLATHFGTQKGVWPRCSAPTKAGGTGKAPVMPRQQQSPYPAPSTTLAPQRSPHSPRVARSPSNAFTEGEHCQKVFFPSCTKPRWGGRCCYCAFFSHVLKPQRNFHRAAVSPAWREGHAGETRRLKSDFVTASVQPNFSCQGCLGGMCRRLCPLPHHVPREVAACVCTGVHGCARMSSHGHVCAFPRERVRTPWLLLALPYTSSLARSGWFVHKRGRA